MRNQSIQEYQVPSDVSPSTTIILLNKLAGKLSLNGRFGRIHHFGSGEKLQRHKNYLKDRKTDRYNKGSKNEIVAKRLHCIAFLREQGIDIDDAIKKSQDEYPF